MLTAFFILLWSMPVRSCRRSRGGQGWSLLWNKCSVRFRSIVSALTASRKCLPCTLTSLFPKFTAKSTSSNIVQRNLSATRLSTHITHIMNWHRHPSNSSILCRQHTRNRLSTLGRFA
ncbi:hypothetical protein FPV67DRAFT_237862 [Lyophyllum atratum]|nr:hypothetical protein FPV67DRAFT_237862 [Lyophyllum atratum]